MWTTLLTFSQLNEELAREAFQLGKDARDWKVNLAQQDVKRDGGPHRDKIVPILYRPFDVRYTYYTVHSRGFHCMPRPEVMRHMLAGENLALCVGRQGQVVGIGEWTLAFCARNVVDLNMFYRGGSVNMPLYLYPSADSSGMFQQGRQPNLADWLLPRLSAAYGFTPSPEEVLAYIYAILYSPAYRETYAQELHTDFPRIPFTVSGDLFRQMADLGQRLIDLHLLKSSELDSPAVRYQGTGSNDKVDYVQYDEARQRVYINADKYFEGITPEMWAYHIGGYQVLKKYLKDRKGRRLDDPVHYIRMATAIARTIEVQREIETIYPGVEVSTLVLGKASTAPQGKAGSASEGETSS